MKDRVIVITGASAGVGAALAENVAKKGANVVLVARREKELAEVAARCGASALAVVADVTKRADFERVVRTAIDRFGHVDVLVNNVGRAISRPVSKLTDEDIDEMILLNVKTALYGMQAILPHFEERGRGQIVNVSSMLGRIPAAFFRSAYCAAKAALNQLTACLRMELRHQHPNIHVTTVTLGIVATDFGLNARHGGVDNRKLPGAVSAESAAEAIAGAIESPRADVYNMPDGRERVVAYFGAEDMGSFEDRFSLQRRP